MSFLNPVFSAGNVSYRDGKRYAWFFSLAVPAVLGLAPMLYLWTGWTGRALSRGNAEARDVHRFAAAAAIGASFLSAIAGFTLLP